MPHSTATQLTSQRLEVSRLLFDLKKCTTLISQLSGCLEPDTIAKRTTDGLVEHFDCAFARIWLVEPDRSSLKLVASSGLYTHLTGSFARIPMGAFKVGKIAQHCIPFLSNCLAKEAWVKDRQWAIENNIQGFAGLPLMHRGSAIGVIALFSHKPMAPEFLEVLQILSVSVASGVASAIGHQADKKDLKVIQKESLSEILAEHLGAQKLSLLGTEQSLSPAVSQLLIQLTEQISEQSCEYCRLVYELDSVIFEAMLATDKQQGKDLKANDLEANGLEAIAATVHQSFLAVEHQTNQLGGSFQIEVGHSQTVINIRLPQKTGTPASLGISPLSTREQEVIVRLAQGMRDREIAQQLFISDRTVKFHVKNMLKKLNVRTRSQAVFEATKKGWLS